MRRMFVLVLALTLAVVACSLPVFASGAMSPGPAPCLQPEATAEAAQQTAQATHAIEAAAWGQATAQAAQATATVAAQQATGAAATATAATRESTG